MCALLGICVGGVYVNVNPVITPFKPQRFEFSLYMVGLVFCAGNEGLAGVVFITVLMSVRR